MASVIVLLIIIIQLRGLTQAFYFRRWAATVWVTLTLNVLSDIGIYAAPDKATLLSGEALQLIFIVIRLLIL